uniref:LO4 n=1 Tax=Sand tiger adomavirus 1 TaxID=3238819 RepID=A0AB39ACE9_9VIRU
MKLRPRGHTVRTCNIKRKAVPRQKGQRRRTRQTRRCRQATTTAKKTPTRRRQTRATARTKTMVQQRPHIKAQISSKPRNVVTVSPHVSVAVPNTISITDPRSDPAGMYSRIQNIAPKRHRPAQTSWLRSLGKAVAAPLLTGALTMAGVPALVPRAVGALYNYATQDSGTDAYNDDIPINDSQDDTPLYSHFDHVDQSPPNAAPIGTLPQLLALAAMQAGSLMKRGGGMRALFGGPRQAKPLPPRRGHTHMAPLAAMVVRVQGRVPRHIPSYVIQQPTRTSRFADVRPYMPVGTSGVMSKNTLQAVYLKAGSSVAGPSPSKGALGTTAPYVTQHAPTGPGQLSAGEPAQPPMPPPLPAHLTHGNRSAALPAFLQELSENPMQHLHPAGKKTHTTNAVAAEVSAHDQVIAEIKKGFTLRPAGSRRHKQIPRAAEPLTVLDEIRIRGRRAPLMAVDNKDISVPGVSHTDALYRQPVVLERIQ